MTKTTFKKTSLSKPSKEYKEDRISFFQINRKNARDELFKHILYKMKCYSQLSTRDKVFVLNLVKHKIKEDEK